jgi:hypothetical protein
MASVLVLLLPLPCASPAAASFSSSVDVAGPITTTAPAFSDLSPSSNLPGRTFGTAYKGWYKPCFNESGQQNLWPFDRELDVFEHQCSSGAGSVCVMKHLWCGGVWPGYADSRIRYYIDGEAVASVDFPLGLGHGSSMLEDERQPSWSAGSLFGWTGRPSKGGVFNTYPIPFAKSIRVTVTLLTTAPVGKRQHDPVGFWIILRGHEGVSAISLPGGLAVMPPNARLRVFENRGVAVQPGEIVPLLRTRAAAATLPPASSGGDVLVLMVTLAVSSEAIGVGFLEGCMRLTAAPPAGSSSNTMGRTEILLSSGTEDYVRTAPFLGADFYMKNDDSPRQARDKQNEHH